MCRKQNNTNLNRAIASLAHNSFMPQQRGLCAGTILALRLKCYVKKSSFYFIRLVFSLQKRIKIFSTGKHKSQNLNQRGKVQ